MPIFTIRLFVLISTSKDSFDDAILYIRLTFVNTLLVLDLDQCQLDLRFFKTNNFDP